MLQRKIVFFLLLFRSLQATIIDPGNESSTEGDPSSTLCDSVSLLTGDFVASCEDLVIEGARPLRIQRQYVSSNGKGKHGGWEFFPHLEIKTIKGGKGGKSFLVREPNGTRLLFKKRETYKGGWGRFTVDFEKNGKGITNTSRRQISGRTNFRNYTLHYQKDDQELRLICADGTKRIYTYSHKDRTKEKKSVFLLRKETHPDEHCTYYKYDSYHRLQFIKKKNKENTQTYAWCSFEYFDHPKKSQDFQIRTSDGRLLSYTFRERNHSRYFLAHVRGPQFPPESLEYNHRHDETDHLVQARILPEGRKISAEYYLPKESCTIGDCSVSIEGAWDRRVDRVKTLFQSVGEKGESVPTHQFVYHKGRNHTNIYDAYQNLTIFFHSPYFLPTGIHFYEREKLHRQTSMTWDERGQLTEKRTWGTGPSLVRKYFYDEKGNVLQEELSGNITAVNTIDEYSFEQDNAQRRFPS